MWNRNDRLVPKYIAFVIGGQWRSRVGGYNWYPGVVWRTWNYFRQGWWRNGHGWIEFVRLHDQYDMPPVLPINAGEGQSHDMQRTTDSIGRV